MRSALKAAASGLRLASSSALEPATCLSTLQLLQRQYSAFQCSTSDRDEGPLQCWQALPAPCWAPHSTSQSRGYARATRSGGDWQRGGGGGRSSFGAKKAKELAKVEAHTRMLRAQQDALRRVQLGRIPTNAAPLASLPSLAEEVEDISTANEELAEGEMDFMELLTVTKEQIDKANLPPEFKQAMFGSGHRWHEVLVEAKRTAKVTKAGRLETYHGLIVVGNFNGLIGVGQSSGRNLQQVMLDSFMKAYKSVVHIPRYRCHTVYHKIDSTFHGVRVQMWPRPKGFGVTANDTMHELCQMAGITDVTVRVDGRRKNKANVLRAWLDGLTQQSLPHDGVEGSGTYVREVLPGKLPYGLERGVHLP